MVKSSLAADQLEAGTKKAPEARMGEKKSHARELGKLIIKGDEEKAL